MEKIKKEKLKIKKRQVDILLLLYRFRFLNRVQIQSMLNHKYKKSPILVKRSIR